MDYEYKIEQVFRADEDDEISIIIDGYNKGRKYKMTTFIKSMSLTNNDGVEELWDLKATGILQICKD